MKDLWLEVLKTSSRNPCVVKEKSWGLGPVIPTSGLQQASGWNPTV